MTTKAPPPRGIVSVLHLLLAMSAAGSISSAMVPSRSVPAALPPLRTASICLHGEALCASRNNRPRLTGGKAIRGDLTLFPVQGAEVDLWTLFPPAHSIYRPTPCRELWTALTTNLGCQTHRTLAFYILQQRRAI